MTRTARIVFLILVFFTLLFGFRIVVEPDIQSDLNAVVPALAQSPELQYATSQLNRDIQRRMNFVIVGEAEPVEAAKTDLLSALESLQLLQVMGSEQRTVQRLVELLQPYRFGLLSPAQRAYLSGSTSDQLVDDALRSLYGLNEGRMFDFAVDPLALFQESLQQRISALLPAGDWLEEDDSGFATVSAILNETAIGLETQETLGRSIAGILDSLEKNHNVSVYQSGVFFFAADAAQRSRSDIKRISAISSIGLLLLLGAVFAYLPALLLPAISVGTGIAFAAVLTHTAYGGIHLFTLIFGVGLIGVVVDYALHFLYHQFHSGHQGSSVQAMSGKLYMALMLSAATSVLGYAALYLSSVDILQKVAVFSASGILMALVTVMALGDRFVKPGDLSVTWATGCLETVCQLISKLARLFSRLPVIGLLFLAVILVAIPAYRLEFNDNPRLFIEPNAELLASEEIVGTYVKGFEPGVFLAINGRDTEEIHAHYAELEMRLAALPGDAFESIVSPLGWVPSRRDQQINYEAQQALYREGGAVEQLANRLQGLDFAAMQEEFASAGGRYLAPTELLDQLGPLLPPLWFDFGDSVNTLLLLRQGAAIDLIAQAVDQMPGDAVVLIPTVQNAESALRQQRQSSVSLLLLAYVMVGLMLLGHFRKLNALSLLFIPLSATLLVWTGLSLAGVALNLFHVMASFLVLGFGMDYAIFASKMSGGDNSSTAMQAIVLSALTSLLSFGLLSISDIPIVSSFGIVLLLGNLGNLFAVFVFNFYYNRVQV